MENISVHYFHSFEEQPLEKAKVQVSSRIRNLARLLPRILALTLWLAVGICLALLLKDFNKTLAPDRSTLPSWLILAMFLGPSPVIAWLQWRAWRMSAVLLNPAGKVGVDRDEAIAYSI